MLWLQEMGSSNMAIQKLLGKSDYEWYKGIFNKDERKKLSEREMDDIIDKSIQSAEEVFERFDEEIQILGIEGLIKKYGSTISYNDLNKSNTVIAMYDNKENLLIIFDHSIEELNNQIHKLGMSDYISRHLLNNLILSHELYHIIEMNEANIYTYSEIYSYNFLGFSRKKRLTVASEIGAFHFSKLVNEIDFSPCVISSLYNVDEKE